MNIHKDIKLVRFDYPRKIIPEKLLTLLGSGHQGIAHIPFHLWH